MSDAFPAVPGPHALAALLLTLLALALFTRNRIPLELSSFLLLALTALGFTLFPFEHGGEPFEAARLFSGFGHEALVTVCALMIVGQGLVETGALEPFGRLLTRAWAVAPFLSALLTLVLGAILSAFINNTPIVVLLLPVLISVSLRLKSSPARILMPMGFATIVGGMATTIGTSTNLLVVSVARDLGQPTFGMFDFLLPAAIGGTVALVYLWLIAPLLLPDKTPELLDSSPRLFSARLYLGEDSKGAESSVEAAQKLVGESPRFRKVLRDGHQLLPLPDLKLRAGDSLVVQARAQALREAADALGATLYSGDEAVTEDHPLSAENQTIAEIAVAAGSLLDGQNLRYTSFLQRHNLYVLALHRAGRDIWRAGEDIMDVTLGAGDVLLVQGDKDRIAELKSNPEFLVLDASAEVPRTERAPLALGLMLGVVLAAATGIVPIMVSSVCGAVLMLLLRVLDMNAAIRSLSASVILVVAASLAIGQTLEITGASLYLTEVFLYLFASAPAHVMLSALMLLMAVLTNIVSNNAAAVIGTPVAIGIAQGLGVPAEPFILAILFGANLSFVTPMSYKTNLLVMHAGGYHFNDFIKVGLPLALLLWLTFSVVLGVLYL